MHAYATYTNSDFFGFNIMLPCEIDCNSPKWLETTLIWCNSFIVQNYTHYIVQVGKARPCNFSKDLVLLPCAWELCNQHHFKFPRHEPQPLTYLRQIPRIPALLDARTVHFQSDLWCAAWFCCATRGKTLKRKLPTLKQLREKLKELGLPSSGKKAELLEILHQAVLEAKDELEPETFPPDQKKKVVGMVEDTETLRSNPVGKQCP